MVVRAVFVDANEALANAAERIIRLAGLELRVNREPNITPPEIPAAPLPPAAYCIA